MINKVILLGRLCADPEVRANAEGIHVARLRVATNRYGPREEGGSRSEFSEYHNVVLFGRRADQAGNRLRRGRLIYAEGRLQHRSWLGRDGRLRSVSEVVVENLEQLGESRVG